MNDSLDSLGITLHDRQLREVTGATITASVAAQVIKEIKGGALPK